MPLLKPFTVEEQPAGPPPDPPRTCEACGHIVADGSQAINFMMQIGVAGDPRISPFQCPLEEHWACSPKCWREVAHACIDEHMHEVLMYLHNRLGTVHAEKVQENGANENPG